jgi:G3E family GTPase
MSRRRIVDRKGLRADYEAAERRKSEEEEEELDEEEADEDDEDDEEDEDEAEEEGLGDDEEGEDEEDEEDAASRKKKAKKTAAKAVKPKTRTRAAKVVRMKAMWAVFSNSDQCVATYEYPRRQEAEEHARKLAADKKTTYFVQMIKEPLEEKDKEKK